MRGFASMVALGGAANTAVSTAGPAAEAGYSLVVSLVAGGLIASFSAIVGAHVATKVLTVKVDDLEKRLLADIERLEQDLREERRRRRESE